MLKERCEDYHYSSWSKQKQLQSTDHIIWDKPKIRIKLRETEMTWETEMLKSKIKIMLASESRMTSTFGSRIFLKKKLDIISERLTRDAIIICTRSLQVSSLSAYFTFFQKNFNIVTLLYISVLFILFLVYFLQL